MANTPIHLITYGDGSFPFIRSAERLAAKANSSGWFSSVNQWNFNLIEAVDPAWANQHRRFIESQSCGHGYWLWKPKIIQLMLDLLPENEMLLYLDAGCELNLHGDLRFSQYIDWANLANAVFFSLKGDDYQINQWSKKALLERAGFDLKNYQNLTSPQIEAGVLFLKNNENTRRLISDWLGLMEENHYHLLSDSLSRNGELPTFKEHRHDQSVLTVLAIIRNFGLSLPNENFFPDLWGQGKHPQFAPIAAFRSKGKVARMDAMQLAAWDEDLVENFEDARVQSDLLYGDIKNNHFPINDIKIDSTKSNIEPINLGHLMDRALSCKKRAYANRVRCLEKYLLEVEDLNIGHELNIDEKDKLIIELKQKLHNQTKLNDCLGAKYPLGTIRVSHQNLKGLIFKIYWGPNFDKLRVFKSHLVQSPMALRHQIGKKILAAKSFLDGFYPIRLGRLYQYSPKALNLNSSFSFVDADLTSLPSLSIVTPSFEQGHFLERTIESVLNQKYPCLEYFIQDGGSQDKTLEVLDKYKSMLTGVESAPDRGQTHAINLGFSKTSGEIMAWLNSDDVLLPGVLYLVGKYFRDNPDIDVIYGNRLIINEQDMQVGDWVMPPHDNEILSWADFIPQETLFWRRSIWEKCGQKVDESFSFAMDWELLLRFRDFGAKFAVIPKFLGCFRVHSSQKTSALISQSGKVEMDRLRKKYLGFIPTDKEIENAIKHYIAQHRRENFLTRLRGKTTLTFI
jgi:glycosyltransferase involved in cell wall biosynthesis